MSVSLLYEMFRIRLVEEAIADRYKEQKMRCPVHLSIGQEAVAVGVCQALKKTDFLISNHRAHAHYLAKGGDLKRMIAEIYGKVTGCCKGRGGSMHLIDREAGMMGSTPIVGGSIPVGVGLAFASKMKKEERVTAIFFGEGATEEGGWAESLNFAALQGLSVLFVCENNFYSVYSPLSVRQPVARDRCLIAKAHGIPFLAGDGNDVEEVLSCSQQAIQSIREGKGPFFLEFTTYRHREHCGPHFDNHIGYRTEEEFLAWKTKCPIELQLANLLKINHLSKNDWMVIRRKIENEIAEAFSYAEESHFPEYTLSDQTPFYSL